MDDTQHTDIQRLSEMVAQATGVDKLRLTGQLMAAIKNGGVDPSIVSIYNNPAGTLPGTGAPQDQGQGNIMPAEPTTPALDTSRMDKREIEARRLLSEGFTTKAAQQRAKEQVSRAFSVVISAIQKVHLDGERGNPAGEAAYFGMPMYPHEWKQKHVDLIKNGLPDAAVHIPDADRLAQLSEAIKATPILTKIADEKAAKEKAAQAVQSLNPSLRAEFEAQAPAIASDYESYMRATYAVLEKKFPEGVPAYVGSTGPGSQYRQDIMMMQGICDVTTKPGPSGIKGYDDIRTLTLNEARLKTEAEDYGMAAALEWFYKTNGKLGELENAELHKDNGGDVHVSGTRGGRKVEIVQQRIINVSPLGKVFHQFPSRIYVTGKFMTELDYQKL